jgi:hypothetical protein
MLTVSSLTGNAVSEQETMYKTQVMKNTKKIDTSNLNMMKSYILITLNYVRVNSYSNASAPCHEAVEGE